MYQSEKIEEIIKALVKAQQKISKAEATCINSFFNSKYANLDAVFTMCKGPLNENGIAISQMMGYENGELCVVTQLSHESGQWMRSVLPVKYDHILNAPPELDKSGKEKKQNALQKLGSTITYLKRYGLSSIVGCGGEQDDDGNTGLDVHVSSPEKNKTSEFSQKLTSLADAILLGYTKEEVAERKLFFTALKNQYKVSHKLVEIMSTYENDPQLFAQAFNNWKSSQQVMKDNMDLAKKENV